MSDPRIVQQDARSITLQHQLATKWKNEIKRKPPADREKWLKSQEGIVGLGARTCNQLLRSIKHQRESAEQTAPSQEWIEAIISRGQALPIATRNFPGGMRLSQAKTSYGNSPRHRRYYPAECVGVEDHLDALSEPEAIVYTYPPSPSALAIFRASAYSSAAQVRLSDRSGRNGRRRATAGAKRRQAKGDA